MTGGCHGVVRDPGNKVITQLVLHATHLLLHLLHGDLPSHDGGNGEVPASPGVTARHAVAAIEELGDQLADSELLVFLAAATDQGGESRHEEVESGERNHVDCQLPQVSIKLAGEPEGGGDSGHGEGHQVVQVTVGGVLQLQGPERVYELD